VSQASTAFEPACAAFCVPLNGENKCYHAMQVDALIIGGNWGKKDRSGMLGEYVFALADGPAKDSMSPFLSFCRSVHPRLVS